MLKCFMWKYILSTVKIKLFKLYEMKSLKKVLLFEKKKKEPPIDVNFISRELKHITDIWPLSELDAEATSVAHTEPAGHGTVFCINTLY